MYQQRDLLINEIVIRHNEINTLVAQNQPNYSPAGFNDPPAPWEAQRYVDNNNKILQLEREINELRKEVLALPKITDSVHKDLRDDLVAQIPQLEKDIERIDQQISYATDDKQKDWLRQNRIDILRKISNLKLIIDLL